LLRGTKFSLFDSKVFMGFLHDRTPRIIHLCAVFIVALAVVGCQGTSDERQNRSVTQRVTKPFTVELLNENGEPDEDDVVTRTTVAIGTEITEDQVGFSSFSAVELVVDGEVIRALDGGGDTV
jgi:hypothetical protein